MTPRDFLYWLQGFFELQPDLTTLTPEQVKAIKEHLKLALTKVTPTHGGLTITGGAGWDAEPRTFC